MDCRKARYFLIASFDGELDSDTKKSLSYHLKDCKKCRHEAFYYRELFSAKENLTELEPAADFNEKLVATIRLRDAQAQWPQPEPTRTRARKWQFALVPPVFAAAAVAAFMVFSAETGVQNDQVPGGLAERSPQTNTATAPVEPAPVPASTEAPRYNVYGSPQLVQSQPSAMIRNSARSALQDHPFASQMERLVGASQQDPLAAYRTRQRTRYVLPVVNNANVKERIY